MRRGARTLAALAALASLALLATAALATAGPEGPSLSLRAPAQVAAGETVTVSGAAVAAPAGSRVRAELRSEGRWRPIGGAELRHGRFRLSFEPPDGARLVRVRVQLRDGGRRLTVSPVRAVRVRGAAPAAPDPGPGTSSPPVATTAPAPGNPLAPVDNGPAPVSEPPVEPPAEPPVAQPYEGPMYWGAWIKDAPWDWHPVDAFEAEAGKPLSLLQFSAPFADCTSGTCVDGAFPLTPFQDIRAHGAIPVLSWGSQSIPGKDDDPEFQLADLIDRSHDGYLEDFADAAAAWGHPFFLRFDWEMNGNWFPWGNATNGNQPGEFVAAWRHVHDVFAAAGATNVSWVWCPYVRPHESASIAADTASFYPGDEYVDWTCLDGYNWGTHPELKQNWIKFANLYGRTYDEIAGTIAPSKPMMIGEVASSETGGSKATWIEEMFRALPTRFPAVRALLWFDVPDEGHDWPLSTSSSAAAAFAAGVAGSRWLSNSFDSFETSPIPPPG